VGGSRWSPSIPSIRRSAELSDRSHRHRFTPLRPQARPSVGHRNVLAASVETRKRDDRSRRSRARYTAASMAGRSPRRWPMSPAPVTCRRSSSSKVTPLPTRPPGRRVRHRRPLGNHAIAHRSVPHSPARRSTD
jgi:hypothetical protein